VEKLNEAAVGGDLNKMRELLSTPGVNIDAKYQGSETPLITACYEGHLQIAQLLIERGANINLKDSVGSFVLRSGVCLWCISLPNALVFFCMILTATGRVDSAALGRLQGARPDRDHAAGEGHRPHHPEPGKRFLFVTSHILLICFISITVHFSCLPVLSRRARPRWRRATMPG
jgi:hypothetical protein